MIFPITYAAIPLGVALARSSMPSSRSTASSPTTPSRPPNAKLMPITLGSVSDPRENVVPGTWWPRIRNRTTSWISGRNMFWKRSGQ